MIRRPKLNQLAFAFAFLARVLINIREIDVNVGPPPARNPFRYQSQADDMRARDMGTRFLFRGEFFFIRLSFVAIRSFVPDMERNKAIDAVDRRNAIITKTERFFFDERMKRTNDFQR